MELAFLMGSGRTAVFKRVLSSFLAAILLFIASACAPDPYNEKLTLKQKKELISTALNNEAVFLKKVALVLSQKELKSECGQLIRKNIQKASNVFSIQRSQDNLSYAIYYMNKQMFLAERSFVGANDFYWPKPGEEKWCTEFTNSIEQVLSKVEIKAGSDEQKYKELLLTTFQPSYEQKEAENILELNYYVYLPQFASDYDDWDFELFNPLVSINTIRMISLHPQDTARFLIMKYIRSTPDFEKKLLWSGAEENDSSEIFKTKAQFAASALFNRTYMFGYTQEAKETMRTLKLSLIDNLEGSIKQGFFGAIKKHYPVSASVAGIIFGLCNNVADQKMPTWFKDDVKLETMFKEFNQKAQEVVNTWYDIQTEQMIQDINGSVVWASIRDTALMVTGLFIFDEITIAKEMKLVQTGIASETRIGTTYNILEKPTSRLAAATDLANPNETKLIARRFLRNDLEGGRGIGSWSDESGGGGPPKTPPFKPVTPGGSDGGVDVLTEVKTNVINKTQPKTSGLLTEQPAIINNQYKSLPAIGIIPSIANNTEPPNNDDQNSEFRKKPIERIVNGRNYVSEDGGITYKKKGSTSNVRYWLVNGAMVQIPENIRYEPEQKAFVVFDPNKDVIVKKEYYDPPHNKKIKSIKPIKDNMLNGTAVDYYENGVIQRIAQYKDGKLNGEIIEYYASGITLLKAYYSNGIAHGYSTRYDVKGNIVEMIEFDENGDERSHTVYDSEGNSKTLVAVNNNGISPYEDINVDPYEFKQGLSKDDLVQIKKVIVEYMGDKVDPDGFTGDLAKQALETFNSKQGYKLTEKEKNMLFGKDGEPGVIDYLNKRLRDDLDDTNIFPIQLIKFRGLKVNKTTVQQSYDKTNKILLQYVNRLINNGITKKDVPFMLGTEFFIQLIQEGTNNKVTYTKLAAQYLLQELRPFTNGFTKEQLDQYARSNAAFKATNYSFEKNVQEYLSIDFPKLRGRLEKLLNKSSAENFDPDAVQELAQKAVSKILSMYAQTFKLSTSQLELLIDAEEDKESGLIYYLISYVESNIEGSVYRDFKAAATLLDDLLSEDTTMVVLDSDTQIKYNRYRKITLSLNLKNYLQNTSIIDKYRQDIKKKKK